MGSKSKGVRYYKQLCRKYSNRLILCFDINVEL